MKDLDKLRDEKCIPIAQDFLKELSKGLFLPDGSDNTTPLVKIFLSRMLEENLEVGTEASYIPQLILGGLSILNTTLQACDTVPVDDMKYGNIASKILSILVEGKVDLLSKDLNKDLQSKLNTLIANEKLNTLEIRYIRDMIFESFTEVNNLLSRSIEESTTKMECKILGIEPMDKLTMQKLNEVSISDTIK